MSLPQPASRARAQTALRASEERYRALYDGTPSMYFTVDPDGLVLSVNQYGATYLGYTPNELLGRSVLRVFVEEDKAKAVQHVAECLAHPGEVFRWELRKVRKDGSRLWVKETARALRAPDGSLSVLIVCEDITDAKFAERLALGQNQVLELIATNAPLAETLAALARLLEAQAEGMLCSILLLDDDGIHLRHGAAPSLPQSFFEEVDGIAIGPNAGSCGTAAYLGEPVIVTDVQTHPLWKDCRDLAIRYGLRACWSHPIFTHDNRVLGTFAIYHREVRSPTALEMQLVELAVHVAGIAIARERAQTALRASEERYRALYDDTPSMYFTVAPDGAVLCVNEFGASYLGYAREELVGESVLKVFVDADKDAACEQLQRCLAEPGRVFHWELRKVRKDGSELWVHETARAVPTMGGKPAVMIVCEDITERVRYERELERQANHDFLTGLANRNLLRDRVSQTLVQAQRQDWRVGVVFIDLDHFKVINDSMGHNAGDALVRTVAQRLLMCVREVDTVARLGGDEFVIVLPDAKNEDAVTATMQRVQQALLPPFTVEDRELFVTCSMGAALFPRDGRDGETLLKHADIAMYRAKDSGRNTFQYYRADMNIQVNERLSMESSLRRALEKDEFTLHYQPIVETASGRIVGAEALLRWNHPQEGVIEPVRLIPVAEETGLIIPIGEWVLDQACRQASHWREHGGPSVSLAVNLSARQFRQRDLVATVERALLRHRLDAALLHLELTESMVMQHIDDAMGVARRLKALGVSLSLDDFGTGYSSLNYLKRFPIDTVKIDRSFVRGIPDQSDDAAIAAAVIAMARSLDITVVAEGVEAPAQFEFLGGKHCEQVQGYYISRPLPATEFERFIQTWSPAAN